jgi:hypothetical protein
MDQPGSDWQPHFHILDIHLTEHGSNVAYTHGQ